MSYSHALLLLTRCESCGQHPQVVVTEDDKKVCARCGLTAEKESVR